MTKIDRWKGLISPFIPDQYSRNDVWVGLGITTFAMIGIFVVSIFGGLIQVTNVGFDIKSFFFYTGLTILSSGYEELIFRCSNQILQKGLLP